MAARATVKTTTKPESTSQTEASQVDREAEEARMTEIKRKLDAGQPVSDVDQADFAKSEEGKK